MENIDNLITMLRNVGNELAYDKICEFSDTEREEYNKLLEELKRTNSSDATNAEKGKSLEDIASFLLRTGNIFEIYNNIHTSTNELDQLVRVNNTGKLLCSNGIIDKRLRKFIGECKNYKDKVSVTYVGKICSLLTTTNNQICILFSYNGVTGNDWEDASGLIKKFYLSKENEEDRFCIIDFNINDFESIKNGSNLLTIIENKLLALQNDTNYADFLSEHESSEKILKLQEN